MSIHLRLASIEENSFRRYRRNRSLNDSHLLTGITPFPKIVSVSLDDYFAVLHCSTSERVSHIKLDWYFQSSAEKSPRVIWQRGRSNIHRYTAYSPDQRRHYLQIKPVYLNDTGVYICIDQSSGDDDRVELFVRKFPFVEYSFHS